MKIIINAVAVSFLAIAMTVAVACHAAEINDVADVVSAQPLMRQVSETRQNCTSEVVQEQVQGSYNQPQQKSYVGPVIGAITGGIIGHQVGRGTGNTVSTAAGAAVGAMVGDNMSNNQPQQYQPQVQTRTIQRCQPYTTTQDVPNGYEVTYRYKGKIGRTHMQYQPGQQINVGINAQ